MFTDRSLTMSRICNYRTVSALAGAVKRHAGRLAASEAGKYAHGFRTGLAGSRGGSGSGGRLQHGRGNPQQDAGGRRLRRRWRQPESFSSLAPIRTGSRWSPTISSRVRLENVTTEVKVDFKAMTVQVAIEKQYDRFIRISSETKLRVTAKAKMSGSMPLCLLGLDPKAPETIGLEKDRHCSRRPAVWCSQTPRAPAV